MTDREAERPAGAAGPGGPLTHRIGALAGAGVAAAVPIGGGCINDGYRVDLDDGRRIFAKTRSAPPPGMYAAESRGLRWLADADAVAVPEPLAASDDLLLMEWIEPGGPRSSTAADLGRGIAALHRAGAATFGLDEDNFIGDLPQDNAPCDDWATFYRARRLEPLARRADALGRLDDRARGSLARLLDRLPRLVGDPEPPARVHGDLWSGNVLTGTDGRSWLIDPAAHGGHREVDLAMMRLFGGFGPATFAAYEESHPLAEGHAERVGLWQLAPLLVHLVLFGGSYAARLGNVLERYA